MKEDMTKQTSHSHTLQSWPAITAVPGAVLFFFAVCLSGASTIKSMTLGVAAIAVLFLFWYYPTLSKRVGGPILFLAAVLVMDGVSTFYSVAGKFALYEFLKLLFAFCLTLILLSLAPGEGEKPGRWIAGILAGFSALSGLISIDFISTRLLSGPVLALLERITPDYTELTGVEAGVRMTSIFSNPNVFAGVVGIGVLLCLGLICSSQQPGERACLTALLYINALSFLLAFSMGAVATIAIAFLIFLLLEEKGKRISLFLLMGETLILSVGAAAVISATSLQKWNGVQPVPMLSVGVGMVLLCLADRWVGQPLAARMNQRIRLFAGVITGVIALSVVAVMAALLLTGPITLGTGEYVKRAADMEPGSYTLALDTEGDGPLYVTIESQNRLHTMMHTGNILYRGPASEASFVVPEDSLVVYFTFSARGDIHINSASYVGEAGAKKLPLDYLLLPGFIANRLQGLWANENAIQRLVFFADGIQLFQRSPIIGLGLGSFENAIKSVQSFFYETKYAHNHYIQTLLETGVVGLLLLVILLLASAVAILRHRRQGEAVHPLTPALGAALVFMAGHAAVEVVFSAYPYLPIAFGVFGLISLCCVSPSKAAEGGKHWKGQPLLIVLGVLIIVYEVLLGCNIWARALAVRESNLSAMEQAVKLDRFEWADYALSYVEATISPEVNPEIRQTADRYAERLASLNSNIIPLRLSRYYFETDRPAQAFHMAEQYVSYVSSDPNAWGKIFDILMIYEQDTEEYRSGVIRIAEMLRTWNEAHLGTITLGEKHQAFITRLGG